MRFIFENQWMEIPDSIYDSFVEDFDSVITCVRLLNYEIDCAFGLYDTENGYKQCNVVKIIIYNDVHVLTLKFYLDSREKRNVVRMQIVCGDRGDKTIKNRVIYRQTYKNMSNFFKSVRTQMGGL